MLEDHGNIGLQIPVFFTSFVNATKWGSSNGYALASVMFIIHHIIVQEGIKIWCEIDEALQK